ncbi:hypothetical protein C7N43_05640 [Sphingobacteriales bacterium UPWRP_1]|nr:hypothetical protein BVG80_06510 [Sphingobacteriales bacterium TSM_CSM]PSJ78061.1 hypothetical protein C7N43_05640 [Sphingobacteriales bacterium UPWRP_1]
MFVYILLPKSTEGKNGIFVCRFPTPKTPPKPLIPKFLPVIPFCFFAVANLLSFGNGNPQIIR